MTSAPVELCCSSALAAEGGAAVCLLMNRRIIRENMFSHKKAQKAQKMIEEQLRVQALACFVKNRSLKAEALNLDFNFVLFVPFVATSSCRSS
jgi:hypothetical protein